MLGDFALVLSTTQLIYAQARYTLTPRTSQYRLHRPLRSADPAIRLPIAVFAANPAASTYYHLLFEKIWNLGFFESSFDILDVNFTKETCHGTGSCDGHHVTTAIAMVGTRVLGFRDWGLETGVKNNHFGKI